MASISLLIFGGDILQAFAIAILVGIASGTYSSIFIASPVLALWKEREPGFRRRRRQQIETQGYVPAFAEELEVARFEDGEDEVVTDSGTDEPDEGDAATAAAPGTSRPPAGHSGPRYQPGKSRRKRKK